MRDEIRGVCERGECEHVDNAARGISGVISPFESCAGGGFPWREREREKCRELARGDA